MSCPNCNTKFAHNALRISCGKCDRFYHKKCIKVSNDEWTKLTNGEFLFNCESCKSKRRSSVLVVQSTGNGKNASMLDGTNVNTDGVKFDLSSLKNELKSFQSITKDVEASLTHLHDTVASLESKIDSLTDRLKDVDIIMAENTRLRHRIDQLESRMVTVEKSNNLMNYKMKAANSVPPYIATVSGIESTDNELVDKMKSLFTELDVNYDDAVVNCNRPESKDKAKKVVFISMKNRDVLVRLIKAAKAKRPNNIFINEKLSPSCYKLLKEAKTLRQCGFKHVWSSGGSVLARKEDRGVVSVIRSSRDIEALKTVST